MTDANGIIDYNRVFKLIAAAAGVFGIGIALWATIHQLTGHPIVDYTLLGWIVTALIAPITGGQAAAGLGKALLGRNGNGADYSTTVNVVAPPTPPTTTP